MSATFVFTLIVLLLLSVVFTYEHAPVFAKTAMLVIVSLIIWMSLALTRHEQKKKFICKIPIQFQKKVAFSIHENKIINCSDNFNAQFKPGDSVSVFKEVDTWVCGILWKSSDYVYTAPTE